MHPPSQACIALHRLHPQLRLAWVGRKPKFDGELNPGSFALVQLYHVRDAGKPGEEVTFRELWHTTSVMGEDGTVRTQRVERGPIFNRFGGTTPDWNAHERVPIYVANLEDFGVSTADVFNRSFLEKVDTWLTPIKQRVRESRLAAGRALESDAESIAQEASQFLWREAQKSDATTPMRAYKHCKDEMKIWEQQTQKAADLKNYYQPEL